MNFSFDPRRILKRETLKQRSDVSNNYNIPITAANKSLLQQAKKAVRASKLSEALQLLLQINTSSLEKEVGGLSARLARHRQENIQGVLTYEEHDRTLNKISQDVLTLVTALEQELASGSKYQQIIREYLLKRYTNRLGQKMAHRQPINLRLVPTTEGTSKETSANFESISSEVLKGYILGVFGAAQGRLLLTGVPGVGKTSVLLELAVGLLQMEIDRLPVLLNLATWKKEYTTLESWLKEILPAEMGVSVNLAADILQQDRLILLFDGFDEIKIGYRESCLEAIGRYGATAHRQFVITSRIAEYIEVVKDAPVYQQIEVGAFTLSQIEDELERLWRDQKQPEAKPLLSAIKHDKVLRVAVEVPFYFNTLQLLVAGGKRVSDLQVKDKTVTEIQASLTDKFVEYELGVIYSQKYTPEQAKHYLSFLAFNMNQKNIVVFELVDLQYDWNARKLSRWELFISTFIDGLINGIFSIFLLSLVVIILFSHVDIDLFSHAYIVLFGLFSIVLIIFLESIDFFVIFAIFSLIFSAGFGNFFGSLVFSFIAGVYGIFIRIYEPPVIKTRNSPKWDFYSLLEFFLSTIAQTLIGSFFTGICVLPFSVVFYGLNFGFWVGFSISLLLSFFVALAYNIQSYFEYYSVAIIQIEKPDQRFKGSMNVFHFSILQYYHLLHMLSKKDLLPFHIVDFLNDMTTRHILESDGATWRFRHRILQEYFANRYSVPSQDQTKPA